MRKRAPSAVRARDLRLSTELPGMLAERLAAAGEAAATTWRSAGCAMPRGSNAFCEIGSVCFHVPIPWFHQVFDNATGFGNTSRVTWAITRANRSSTAASWWGAARRACTTMATLPGSQRRGFGEAVMRHALAEPASEHAIERLVLQSTAKRGSGSYERMGFRTVTKVAVYSS